MKTFQIFNCVRRGKKAFLNEIIEDDVLKFCLLHSTSRWY